MIVADLTPDEGGPFEAVAAGAGLAVVYLVAPTTEPARRAVGRRPLRRLPVLRLAGRRDRCPGEPAGVGRRAWSATVKAVSPVPGRGRLRGQPAGPRPGDRPGRRGRRDRRLGPRRRARPRRPRRGRPGATRRRASGRPRHGDEPGHRIPIGEEAGKTRSFAWALDWPGWCRAQQGPARRCRPPWPPPRPRYARVAALAGLDFVADPGDLSAGRLRAGRDGWPARPAPTSACRAAWPRRSPAD